MKQWYCNIGGQQYGPVSEEVLEDWIDQGRVLPECLVWSEGMADWITAARAMPDMFGDEYTPSAMSMVPVKPPGGTGGMTPNAQLMTQARQALTGRWGTAILVTLVLILISAAMQHIPVIGPLASLICSGAIELGAVIFFLTCSRRGPGEVGMLFKGFKNFGNSLGAYWLRAIFTALWMLLLIIPGIIAAYSYSQTMYLLANDRALGPLEAIRKSTEMMRGHKWRLFCLHCRFIGWAMLCALPIVIGIGALISYTDFSAVATAFESARHANTPQAIERHTQAITEALAGFFIKVQLLSIPLSIGYLWLVPYIHTSLAKFHDDLMPAPARRHPTAADAPDTFG